MTSTTTAAPGPGGTRAPGRDVPQYSHRAILAVWAAAALPMAALSWIVAPIVAARLDGPLPLARALLGALGAGLAWQFLLVLALVGRERLRGELGHGLAGLRQALWLTAPRDPRTGRRSSRAWWALVPLFAGLALVQLLPLPSGPASRDLGSMLGSDAGRAFFHGNWPWFAVVVAVAGLNTVLGEELLFRGFLLPRMREAYGRNDWRANGVLFALYHLHQPWSIPTALFDTVLLAWPTRHWRSAWFGIALHSVQSVVIVTGTLVLVLRG